jgi:excisionase family DNA binding protein
LRLLTPAEVARTLGCSEWWVKEQARRRRIPFTKAGGAYRFTVEHVYEIVHIFEQRPAASQEPEAATGRRRRASVVEPVRPVAELRARRPRRARTAA